MQKMLRENTKVIANNKINKNYFEIILDSSQIIRSVQPGQFLEIKVSKGCTPLLRRPFSVHYIRGQKSKQRKQMAILYEAVGIGTELLSQKKAGEYLDVIGPLGNGFSYPLSAKRTSTSLSVLRRSVLSLSKDYTLPILVAGGMGVAPLLFLAEQIKSGYTLHATR